MKPLCDSLQNLVIRKFCMEDYDALIKLWNDAGLSHKPKGRDRRDKIEKELKRGRAIFLVAEIDNKLVGSVFGTHDGRKGWTNRLAVAPEFQGQGIARKLIAEAENRIYKLGIEIIACLIEDWNLKSMKVFEKSGYTKHPNILYLTKRKNPDV